MSEPSQETPARSNRARVIAAVVAAAVLAAVVALVVSTTGGDPEPAGDGGQAAGTSAAPTSVVPATAAPSGTPAAGSEPAATGTSSPTSSPASTEPSSGSADEPPALPAVALTAPASAGDGVVATLPEVVAIEGSGTGPGNIAGPAVRVTVEVRNGTSEAIELDQVAVNAYSGADRTPASPLADPAQRPFAGSLAPGETATAVQVFSVPAEDLGAVTIEVGYRAGAPLLLFTGAVG
jgi:hypothetical protein